MSFIAIVGAGPIGGALAHRLAARGRTREVRLIDDEGRVAQGKALDILQSAPIEGFSTRLSSSETLDAAAGADVVVIADAARDHAEHAGEAGLAMIGRLAAIDTTAPIVFAGASQRTLIARAVSEVHLRPRRVIGTAPAALESAVRALAALELNGTGTEIQLIVVGVPPRAAVVGWDSGTAHGQPLSTLIAPHRLAAISARLPGLWPPGPQVLASAACRAAEALASGSRRRYTCFVPFEDPPFRGAVGAVPVELGAGGVGRVLVPALSRQERTQFENALAVPWQ